MTTIESSSQPGKTFVESVKQALEHLYDFAHLQVMALAAQMAVTRQRESETSGHHLRRELLIAIEALSPGPGAGMQTPDGRLYNVLQLHYVDGLTVQDVGQRLGLSTRQVHRVLRRAEASVATILWERLAQAASAPASAAHLSSVQAEIAHLDPDLEAVDLRPLLTEAQEAVAPLAAARGTALQFDLPDEPLVVSVDAAVFRQLVVSILSRIIQLAPVRPVTMAMGLTETEFQLSFAFMPPAGSSAVRLDDAVAPLAAKLGWQLIQTQSEAGTRLVLSKLQGPLVLVVDDNEGLVTLLERYLVTHDYRVVTAGDSRDGLAQAEALQPAAIILDAMMPGMSGWDMLQRLRARPETAETPIIVCSVFNDPDLARALGASHFISKPVSRDTILEALRALEIV